jgi:hypothetical protein
MANGAGSRIDHDVVVAIRRLLRGRQYSPKQVRDILDADDRYVGRVPDERTIRRIRGQMEAQDPSDQWRFPGQMTPEDARLVMDVLAWLRTIEEPMTTADGITVNVSPIQWVSELEAEWIVTVRRAYPDMPLGFAWYFATSYVEEASHPENRSLLDQFLSETTWRDEPGMEDTEAEALFWSVVDSGNHSGATFVREFMKKQRVDRLEWIIYALEVGPFPLFISPVLIPMSAAIPSFRERYEHD